MANKNRFTIEDVIWRLQADTATNSVEITGGIPDQGSGPNGVGEARPLTMGTWSELQALIDATPNGRSLDLRGLGFEPENEEDENPTNNGKDLIVIGGYLTGTKSLPSWTDLGGGVFSADIELSWLTDMRNYLVDDNQAEGPALKVYPAAPVGYGNNRFSFNENWLVVNNTNDAINNGTIQTTLGDDANGGTITGFTITDPTLRAEITTRVNTVGISSMGIGIHAGANSTNFNVPSSWDSNTGVMSFADQFEITYNGYTEFCMYGGQDLASGEYSIDINNDKVYYNPVNGDPTTAALPVQENLFQMSTGGEADLEFHGTTFIGGSMGAYNASLLAAQTGAMNSCKLRNCSFSSAKWACHSSVTDMERCTFDRFESAGVSVTDGFRAVNCVFTNMENRSAIICQGNVDATEEIRPTLIQGCYFSLPTTGHGQGISLYQDAWINSTVENCIFFNCSRAMSFQPKKPFGSGHPIEGVMKFNNNLIVINSTPMDGNYVKTGQAVLAFNGDIDDELDSSQVVEFRHNTVFADEDILTGSVYTSFTANLNKLINSTLTLESNIWGRISTVDSDEAGLGGPSRRFANLVLPLNGSPYQGNSWGATDLPFFSNTSDVFDRLNLTTKGVASNGAADGGPIGVRWSTIPTQAQLDSITVDWTDTYIPQTPPRSTSYSLAWGDDNTPPSG